MTKYLVLTMSCTAFLGACGDDEPATPDARPAADASSSKTLTYNFGALPQLGDDYVYEGWLIVDGAAVAAGRFTVDASGATTPAEFTLTAADADAADVFVLTIEPSAGDDPAPSSTHILAGDLASGSAVLTAEHAAALGTDFASASGSYFLATPTTGDDTLSNQGIWWLSPQAGLTLPTLPAGWAYEGWIVDGTGPVSTGRFTDPAAADSDGAGSAKGPVGDGPPFPGQDYIDPAKILGDGSTVAVISVEPDPDDSPGPFLIKPLVHDPIGSEVAPTTHDMVNNAAATLPAGSATIAAN